MASPKDPVKEAQRLERKALADEAERTHAAWRAAVGTPDEDRLHREHAAASVASRTYDERRKAGTREANGYAFTVGHLRELLADYSDETAVTVKNAAGDALRLEVEPELWNESVVIVGAR